MSLLDSLNETIDALDLRPEHEALVELARGLARQIDEDGSRAALWREYRPAVELLIQLGEVEHDDGEAALLELVRPPVGDSETA